MTVEEVDWLDEVDKLPEKMENAYKEIPPNLTTSALVMAASKLRTCSRELRRIGAPSDRLQPVYALAKKGCAEYDKGARCFTARPLVLASRWLTRPRVGRWTARFSVASMLR